MFLKPRSDGFQSQCTLIHDTRYTIHTSMDKKISEGSTVQGSMFGEVPACTMPRDQVAWGACVAFPDEFGADL